MVERIFQDLSDCDIDSADQQAYLVKLGWSKGVSWESLLQSKRILIISEAGAGKTYECREQAKRLWEKGEPAFFIELADLATGFLRDTFDTEQDARLDTWISSQSEIATFFLDSIDELKLSQGSFERALKIFSKGIENQLGRARIIITTRPVAFDKQIVHRILPVPPLPVLVTNGEAFAAIAMQRNRSKPINEDDKAIPEWREVALMPLSDGQIFEFAQSQNIRDPAALLEDLRKRNALEFARRPPDLIELCADWRVHKYIRTHQEQVATNVRIKLQPREDRREPADISVDKAIEGASRLALAMMVTRRLTIRHNAEFDSQIGEPALDPAKILTDWTREERKALLERPLFGFASYGRVRFHHRSVAEYLAAERLQMLHSRGMPLRALTRLLFAHTRGAAIARPTKRPIAGWLALKNDRIFELLRDHEPAVLLNEGDPESLSPNQRIQALRAYVERYGKGGWRGLEVPNIQIHRFSSPDLASEINRLWSLEIENPDIRRIIFEIIEMGKIDECSDLAYQGVYDIKFSAQDRILALDALIALKDSRLKEIAASLAEGDARWPEYFLRRACVRMFPQILSAVQLCDILNQLRGSDYYFEELCRCLPPLIRNSHLESENLESLRDGLVKLISYDLSWCKDKFNVVSSKSYLKCSLAATCILGLEQSKTSEWLYASALALRLYHNEYSTGEANDELKAKVMVLSSEENARFFWCADSVVKSVRAINNPRQRLGETIFQYGFTVLQEERDIGWITDALGDIDRSIIERTMLLEAAMYLFRSHKQWKIRAKKLLPVVADQADLVALINNYVTISKPEEDDETWVKRAKKQEAQRKKHNVKSKKQRTGRAGFGFGMRLLSNLGMRFR